MQSVRSLEILDVFTPLGIRFWDPLTATSPRTGIRATAAPDLGDRLGPERAALVTASGIFAFRNLPGLRAVERPDGTSAATSPELRQPFVLQVRDAESRFLSASLRVLLPLPYRGLFPRDPAEPPSGAGGDRRFLLFSAPSRPVAAWHGVITGRLALPDGRAAGHAALRVEFGVGVSHHGFADGEGIFAIQFPFPEIAPDAGASPPQNRALGDLEWPFELRVFYDPGRLALLPGLGIPDYLAVLDQLLAPNAQVFAVHPGEGGAPLESLPGVLRRDREAVARTAGSPALVILPVTSSP
jgi:hypothetical protein